MAIIKPNNNTLSSITALPAAITTGSLVKLSSTTVSSNVDTIDFDGLFSATYDKYLVSGVGLKISASNYVFINTCKVEVQ